ncbi:calmodulin-binding transcription activator 4-like [Rhododendron vialii]|uniref:calmodulin-binding transcription activator 4-like n=1 Tax=Rhododendron vialii TaxID=182163 RepID=UPI00266001B5|nr:calmodulin-binding transcription activator 4-like [Rhododendron vialii]
MVESGYNIDDLVREAQIRWLKPAEVLFILHNYKEDQLTHRPLQKPASGSLFLFNKRVLRFFRKDGHNWRKKKDGRTVGEAHERLKVGNIEALNCYYAHGEQNSKFQRRSYWMLDPAYEHIVLVHYREISEERHGSGSMSSWWLAGSTSTCNQSPSALAAQHPAAAALIGEVYEPYQSPGAVEVSSDAVVQNNGMDHLDRIAGTPEISSSSELEVGQALRRLEEQLSLNDDGFEEIKNENSNDLDLMLNYQCRYVPFPDDEIDLVLQQETGGNGEFNHQLMVEEFIVERKDSLPWKEILEFPPRAEFQEKDIHTSDRNGCVLQVQEIPRTDFGRPNSPKCNTIVSSGSVRNLQPSVSSEYPSNSGSPFELSTSISQSQDVENFKYPAYSPLTNFLYTNPDYFPEPFDQSQLGIDLGADSRLTIAPKQKFTICEISPEWGFSTFATKVVIVGSFLCDPSEFTWTCMFGDIEVPIQIIQEGVICCQAPPRPPGKVTLCITSGNRESCSEIREFEYHDAPSSWAHCSLSHSETTRSPEEMLLLVRFVQTLLSDLLVQGDINESVRDIVGKSGAGEDPWGHVIEGLLDGSWTSSGTTDWLLEEILKDKLLQWLSFRLRCGQQGCFLSKKEQGVIHMVAGLGFEWALKPILNSGVIVDLRDVNGWTALHWAARYGREKMVAALMASGASAGALTDPNSEDPKGKTPASLAAASGHKGLAGYLSEVALTSHLSSLTLEENELSKGSAAVESEIALSSISKRSLASNEDHLSLKDTFAAVRNAVQAAARIQAAFRTHSFRRRQMREDAAAAACTLDEHNILSSDILGMSAASKPAFHNARDTNTAALSIQKKYRGWKGRKGYLAFRHKVVKIQAHVRGYQVRKQYKIICWAVGVLEKVVLRWRRKGVGLRGFRPEMESIDESEEEDILKVFRKQNVEKAIDEAVTRVLSMVDSPDARQQYRRMLDRYRQAKAEKGSGSELITSQSDVSYMGSGDACKYP